MLVRTRTRPTSHIKRAFEVSLKKPGGQRILSYIPLQFFEEFRDFIRSHEESRSTKWTEIAKDSIKKHKQAGMVLRGARFRENLTQKSLAKKSGVSQENISRIENGKRSVGEKLAKKLAKPLKIDYRMLLEVDL